MIYISKQLNKILVLPNFYMTPRNNELINKENDLIIDRVELIDIRNIINLEKIKEICNCISISEYMKFKKKDTILITKSGDEAPFISQNFHTIYGIIKIKKHKI